MCRIYFDQIHPKRPLPPARASPPESTPHPLPTLSLKKKKTHGAYLRDHTLECDWPTKASCIQNNTYKSWNPWPCQLLSWCHIKSFYRPEKRCLFSSYNFLPKHPANCRRTHLGREHLVQTHLFIRKGKGIGSLELAGSRPSKITKQQSLGDPAQRLCLHVDETNAGRFKAQWQAAPRPCNPWRSGFRTPGALCVCTCSHTHTHTI